MAGVNITNPHKKFQFKIELGLLDNFLAQEVTIPEAGADVVEHGDMNFIVKTAGIMKYGTLKINKLFSNNPDALNTLMMDWVKGCQNVFTGGGDIPDDYKIRARIIQLANDGITPRAVWEFEGLWPSKVNDIELSRVSSENTIESVEFQIDKMDKRL